jgi:hypothetical protein
MGTTLSTNLNDPNAVPYFLWDAPMTMTALKAYLGTASKPEWARTMGKILREARDEDVWLFTTPQEVLNRWSEIAPHLGRRLAFWRFLLDQWQAEGLLAS